MTHAADASPPPGALVEPPAPWLLPFFPRPPPCQAYDEFGDEWYFEYPRAWVSRPNSLRKGVVISDFQVGPRNT